MKKHSKKCIRKQMDKQQGITLIALVISIIVMLILAGVSINAIIGDDGIISRTQYSTFLSEMTAVEEAVQMWKAGEAIGQMGEETKTVPAKGLCQVSDLTKTERLVGEVGYYRIWSMTETVPSTNVLSSADSFNSDFESELMYYPAGVQDLFYLDNEVLGIESDKTYVIDIATGMIYSIDGVKLKGVSCYSSNMATAVMSGSSNAPVFAESEISGTGTDDKLAGNTEHEYGFKIIADPTTNNIYKLYNNGDLYAKGIKGIGLNTSTADMEKIDNSLFKEFTIPKEVGSVKKIIPGENGAIYFIDPNDNLWGYGCNGANKFGLTEEQQLSFTGREAIKLNVDGKKVSKVFDTASNSLFVVTTDNKLYGAGANDRAQLGLGNQDVIYKFTEISGILDPQNIFDMNGWRDGTCIWYNNAPSNVPEKSNEWCSYNQFYWTGYSGWGFGGINNGNPTTYSNFKRIWDGKDGLDYDHQIKSISATYASPWILLTNGTVMQSGYGGGGNGSGWVGGGSNVNFFTRTEIQGKTFKNMWCGGTTFILLEDTGVLWGVSTNNVGVIGDANKEWGILNPLENVPFNTADLEEVLVTNWNVFYLLKDKSVYATGSYLGMGLGSDWSTNISGFVCLSNGEYAKSFPKVNSLYGGNSNIGDMVKYQQCKGTIYNNNLLIGQDGKVYVSVNSELMFGNDVLQKNWKHIASNVKYFDPVCPAYIDKNGNLYVAGSDSDCIGLNYDKNMKVKNFTEITDSKIKGKAKKVNYSNGILAVLTTDNLLYATGLAYYNEIYNYSGWQNATENRKDFVEVMTDVDDFSYHSLSRIIKKKDGSIWGFGNWRSWRQDADGNIPTKANSVTTKIIGLYPKDRQSYILDENGKLYYSGDGANYIGAPANTGDYKEWTGNINGEKVKDIVGNGREYIILTENGNLYGWGTENRLGKGTSSTNVISEPEKLPITDVEQIAAGPNWYVAVKKDGTVWGTGSNTYGVLGRWIGIDRKQPNSRYKTAFEWVECPELEL
ncbi:MAG: hypothetical protein K1W33_07140 [Clostridia bacterium]